MKLTPLEHWTLYGLWAFKPHCRYHETVTTATDNGIPHFDHETWVSAKRRLLSKGLTYRNFAIHPKGKALLQELGDELMRPLPQKTPLTLWGQPVEATLATPLQHDIFGSA